MKINVAAICRNEELYIKRFLDHVRHADHISIVDTGSTDKTIEIIDQWIKDNPESKLTLMWDTHDKVRNLARSRSMAASVFPKDELCVWLDIDEYFSDENWIDVIRQTEAKGPVYIEMHNGDSHYYQMKGYYPNQHYWKYRAHEVLLSHTNAPVTYIESFHTEHTPDSSKVRNYLPELAVDATQYPTDERAAFYYCRELCYGVIYRGEDLEEAEEEYRRLMALNPWDDYKALASIELIQAQLAKGRVDVATIYNAVAARSDRVETHATASYHMYQAQDNVTALSFAIQGIACAKRDSNFLFSSVSSNLRMCLDVARYACYNLGLEEQAVYYHALLSEHEGVDPLPWLKERDLLNKVKANGKNKETDATC